jgi:hypothetical protein
MAEGCGALSCVGTGLCAGADFLASASFLPSMRFWGDAGVAAGDVGGAGDLVFSRSAN